MSADSPSNCAHVGSRTVKVVCVAASALELRRVSLKIETATSENRLRCTIALWNDLSPRRRFTPSILAKREPLKKIYSKMVFGWPSSVAANGGALRMAPIAIEASCKKRATDQ